jgi:IS30 family transposase
MEKCSTETEKRYTHFSFEEREEIAIGLETGKSRSQIARELGRNKSSVCREIKRNNAPVRNVKYRASQAHKRAVERKEGAHRREHLANPVIRKYVVKHIAEDGWTPELTAGRIARDLPGFSTNYESIYLFIYRHRRDLIEHLVRGHKKRHKRSSSKTLRKTKIPGRVDIDQRPADIETREEVGHWEADTVVCRQSKAATAVFVERKMRIFIAIKMEDKSAQSMHEATLKALSGLPAHLRKTITYDNGTENALHELTNSILGTKSYFCKPYHSLEKGSIENRNGILRRFFPKKFNWDLTNQEEIDKILIKINSTPMKCLGYKTPAEVFANFAGVALAG